jgi:S-adenosylmethionine synthetase
VRETIREIGYVDPADAFNADGVNLTQYVTGQSWDIGRGVDPTTSRGGEQGAGDQGIMFGYATDETEPLLPLPILLAHGLARGLAEDRRSGVFPWLRPDGKTQVSVVYEGDRPVRVSDALVSTQHAADAETGLVEQYVRGALVPRVLGRWLDAETRVLVNPTGRFVEGGPSADCGLTGRKLIVDTYGGAARHGGGALSGKDPSKVDRSGAYFCRYVARQLVKQGYARRAELQVAYAIGVAQPVSVKVDTFGTGDADAAEAFVRGFDFRPAAIIERLGLLRPIYASTTNYGHFGKPAQHRIDGQHDDPGVAVGGGGRQPLERTLGLAQGQVQRGHRVRRRRGRCLRHHRSRLLGAARQRQAARQHRPHEAAALGELQRPAVLAHGLFVPAEVL